MVGMLVGVKVGVLVGVDVLVGIKVGVLVSVGVAVGSAGAPPHPASNNTISVKLNVCCNSFLLVIALLLSPLRVIVLTPEL